MLWGQWLAEVLGGSKDLVEMKLIFKPWYFLPQQLRSLQHNIPRQTSVLLLPSNISSMPHIYPCNSYNTRGKLWISRTKLDHSSDLVCHSLSWKKPFSAWRAFHCTIFSHIWHFPVLGHVLLKMDNCTGWHPTVLQWPRGDTLKYTLGARSLHAGSFPLFSAAWALPSSREFCPFPLPSRGIIMCSLFRQVKGCAESLQAEVRDECKPSSWWARRCSFSCGTFWTLYPAQPDAMRKTFLPSGRCSF